MDIKAAGLYPYVEAADFEVLLIAYAWDDDPVQLLDLTDWDARYARDDFREALTDPAVLKVAHNCAFERAALRRWAWAYLPPEQWADSMTLAAQNGLPLSLDAAGDALGIQRQKLKSGTLLINYFCKPCKPTLSNGGRVRNLPHHAPDKWAEFCRYCVRDVEAMREICQGLTLEPPAWEDAVRCLDARINERGVLIDQDLAAAAVEVDDAFRAEHLRELQTLTGLDNPNSVAQLKDWLSVAAGLDVESLSKQTVADLIASTRDPVVRRVLELRQQLGKTSTKKYNAMQAAACKDGRVRGLLQYYGAGRTGRWAGRLVQVQNLPQNHLDDLDNVRELVRGRDLETLELCFDSVPDVLSQLIRTAFVAKPGHVLHVADYSAIEARVIAYLAGEKWRQEVFAKGGDIYCSSAAQMFGVPVEKHGINGHLRQKGKVAELACGYGGGVAALKAFGAGRMGLSEAEMQTIVQQWRAASPTIPRFWRNAEGAAVEAIKHPGRQCRVYNPEGYVVATYCRDAQALRCTLPSGHVLTYWGAWLDDRNGRPSVQFMGQNQTTRKWETVDTWGGKLVENIVQAYARDCLAVALLRLDAAGHQVVFHVHDEVVVEAPEGTTWQDVADVMARPIDWAPGLLLRAEGYSTKFYRKD